MNILSPIASGNGAYIIHKALECYLPNYKTQEISPRKASLPLWSLEQGDHTDIIHSIPDQGGLNKYYKKINVTTFHNYYIDEEYLNQQSVSLRQYYKTIIRSYVEFAKKHSSVHTTVSKTLASIIKQDLGLDATPIPNGVNTKLFHPPTKRIHTEEFKLLFSGNPTKRKGIELLKILNRDLPESCTITITSGLRKESIAHQSKKNHELGIKNIGHKEHNEMPQIYRNHSALILPTSREGMSLAALEAMASGLPIITTNIPSMSEIVHNNKGGILCDPTNKYSYLSAIKRLKNNPSLCIDMGEFNRELVLKSHEINNMIQHYKELFESI